MKVGIYLSGLGEAFLQDSALDYTQRLMHEMSYNITGVTYGLKAEKIVYADKKESNVISIIEQEDGVEKIVYRMYEFKYAPLLTRRFNTYNILVKNFMLFVLVIKKIPLLIKRMFFPHGFSRPYQTILMFFWLFIITTAILFTLPACIALIVSFFDTDALKHFASVVKQWLPFTKNWNLHREGLEKFSKIIVSITTLLLLLVPKARNVITTVAEEFVCASNYLEYGSQNQEIIGHLDHLVEYIAEHEPGSKLHYHSYSFGSIIALDYLFPFSNRPSKNAIQLSEALITIGTPVEFVDAYYPYYFKNRSCYLSQNFQWINIYSVIDALATNFRNDDQIGKPEYGIDGTDKSPENISYEASPLRKLNFGDFIFLHSMRVHSMYWDPLTECSSCLRKIVLAMDEKKLF